MENGPVIVPDRYRMLPIEFPILPTEWVAAIPEARPTTEYGHHISKGDQSEDTVSQLFHLPQFEALFSQVHRARKNGEMDKAGIDLRLAVRTETQEGLCFQSIVGAPVVDIQVKSNERKIAQGFRMRNKRGLPDSDGRIVYLNGTYPFEYITADFALQLMAHTHRLHDTGLISEFLEVFDQDNRDCITHPQIIRPIVEIRMPLIRKLYPRTTFGSAFEIAKLITNTNSY